MAEQNKPEDGFWEKPLAELLQTLNATPQGLTSAEAKQRLREHGPNSLVRVSRFATPKSLLLGFFMELQARHAVEQIRNPVASTAAVVRDGKEQRLSISEI